jgi:hypothetical protein
VTDFARLIGSTPARTTSVKEDVRVLRVGRVDLRRLTLAHVELLRVAHDADDRRRHLRVRKFEPLAKRVNARPELLGHRAVDEHDGLRVRAVLKREVAAAQEREPDRVKVVRVDGVL